MQKDFGLGFNIHVTSTGQDKVAADWIRTNKKIADAIQTQGKPPGVSLHQEATGTGTGRIPGGNSSKYKRPPGSDGSPDMGEVQAALERLADNAKFNAELARKIGKNEEGVLDEHAKLKTAIAEQRRAFQRKFDIRTTDGAARTKELAKSAYVDRQQRLAQRAYEAQEYLGTPSKPIATAVMKGGIQREAAVKVLDAKKQREISIAQLELDIAEGSAASMGKRKVLLDQLNRLVAQQVRSQQDIGAIANETVAVDRDRRAKRAAVRDAEKKSDRDAIAQEKVDVAARGRSIEAERRKREDVVAIAEDNADIARKRVAQDREDLKAVTDTDRQKRAIRGREMREAGAKQTAADQAAMDTRAGQAVIRSEAANRAKATVDEAKARQQYLKQFDVKTPAGATATGVLADTAVQERYQALTQRSMEVEKLRATGGVKRIAQGKAQDDALNREIAIAQSKIALETNAAQSIAQEKVLRDQLNRAIAGEVRSQTDVQAIAKENLAVRRQQIKQQQANLSAVQQSDRVDQAELGRRTRLATAHQKLADQAAMRTDIGQRVMHQEARAAAGATMENAARRQQYLKQFDVATPAGRERTSVLASTAVGEREQHMAQRNMEIQQELATGGAKRIAHSKALEATLARQVTIEQLKIDLNSNVAKSMGEQKVLNDRLNRAVAREVRLHTDYAAVAEENLQKQRASVLERRVTRAAETPIDRFGLAHDQLEEERRRREIDRYKRAGVDTGEVAEDTADRRRQSIAQQRANMAAVTPADVKDEAAFAVEKKLASAQARLAEQVEMRTAAGQRLGMEERALATQTAELKAVQAQLKAADQKLIVAEATEARAREETAARVAITRLGGSYDGLQGADLTARAAVLKRARAEEEKTKIAEQTGAAEVDIMARRKLEEAKVRAALRTRERELMREEVSSGKIKGGTWFQQMQMRLRPSENKLPEEYLTGPKFMGEKLQTTVGFMASGMLLGGTIAAISEMFKDATALEQTFVRLRGQMEGIGKLSVFPQIRDQIKEIAAETGQASDKVAGLVARFVGISKDPFKALEEAKSAAKLGTVVGLEPREMEQSIVPIARAYKMSVEQIGDALVDLGEKTGVPEAELLQFFGKTAAAAANAGLSFEELKILGATLANSLGGAFGSAAEGVNKVFTTVVSNADKIIGVMDRAPESRKFIEPFSKQIGEGKPGAAYLTLVKAYQQFNANQKKEMVEFVVSKKEAEDFYAVFDNGVEVMAQVEKQQDTAAASAGKMAKRWEEMQGTVGVVLQRVAATFESLGEALFRSGIADFVVVVGGALRSLVQVLGLGISMFAKFNEGLGGMPSKLIAAALAMYGFNKIYQKVSGTMKGSGGISIPAAAGPGAMAPPVPRVGGFPYSVTGGRATTTTAAPRIAPDAGAAAVTVQRTAQAAAIRQSSQAEVAAGLTTRFAAQQQKQLAAQYQRRMTESQNRAAAVVIPQGRALREERASWTPSQAVTPLRGPGVFPSGMPVTPMKEWQLAQARGVAIQNDYSRATSRSAESTIAGVGTTAALTRSQAKALRNTDALSKAEAKAAESLRFITNRRIAQAGQLAREAKEGVSERVSFADRGMGLSAITGRARGVTERLENNYQARLTAQSSAIERAGLTMGRAQMGVMRSLSGGTLLRSARADATMSAAGQQAGAGFMPVAIMAMIGASAVQAKHEETKTEVQGAYEYMKKQMASVGYEKLRATPTPTIDWMDRVQSKVFGTPIQAEAKVAEEYFARESESGNLAMLGIAGRQITPMTVDTSTKKTLDTQSSALGKRIGAALSDDSKQKFANFFASREDAVSKGMELGLVHEMGMEELNQATREGTQVGAADQAPGSFILAETNGAIANKFGEITDESIAKARDWIEATRMDPNADEKSKILAMDADRALADVLRGEAGLDPAIKADAERLSKNRQTVMDIEASKLDTQSYMSQLAGGEDENYKSVDILKQQFQSGQISQGEYIEGAKKRLVKLKESANNMKGTAKGQEMQTMIGQLEIEVQAMTDASMAWFDNIATSFAVLGSTTPKQVQALKHAATVAKQAAPTRLEQLPTRIQEETAAWQEKASQEYSPEARIAAMNAGPQMSEAVKQDAILKQILDSPGLMAAIGQITAQTGEDPKVVAEIIAKRVKGGKTVQDAVREYMNEKAGELQGQGKYRQASILKWGTHDKETGKRVGGAMRVSAEFAGVEGLAEAEISPEMRELNRINVEADARQAKAALATARAGTDPVKGAAIQAKAAADNYNDVKRKVAIKQANEQDLERAQAEMETGRNNSLNAQFQFAQLVAQRTVFAADRDPVKETAAQMDIARAALAHARKMGDNTAAEQAEQQIMALQRQAADNQLDIVRGTMAVAAAKDAEDPMKSAALALKAAEFELANAHGDADRSNKEASVIAARQRMNETISSALTADAQLAITLATLRGDTVGAATVAAQEAKRKLDEAVAKGITDRNVLAPLEGAVAETVKQGYLAPIQKQISDFDYLYGIEQLSLGDYISKLEGQLSQLTYDSQEYRDLNTKIFGLKKTSSQDTQFNLPSEIQLPTLYEARRLNQSRQMGIGYQDNKNVQVTFNVNGAQDPALVAKEIGSALKGAIGGTGQLYSPGVAIGVN